MTKRRKRATVNKLPPVSSGGGAVSSPEFLGLSNQFKTPRHGTRELLRLYGETPWLRAIIGKIARSVADIDWFLYARKGVAGGYVSAGDLVKRHGPTFETAMKAAIDVNLLQQIPTHPLLELLDRGTGSPRLNGHGVIQVTQVHIDLVGESFWLIERDGLGMPIHIWPLPPSWITELPSETYPYYALSAPGGLRVDIPVTEIVPFIEPHPENPYGRGLGTSQTLDDDIQIEEYAAKHAKSFYLNRARPDIIISGQFISKNDAERLEKQWTSNHQGFFKSFKPLFFSQKIDVKEISHTFESMQMVQMRQHERDTFISIFSVPPEKFGIVGDSKRSTISAADFFWNKDIIKPRIEVMRRAMQQVLIPMFDERLILNYETPVIQDDEHKVELFKIAPWALKINEWRHEMGLEKLGSPLGDMLVVPLNMLPIAATGDGSELSPQQVQAQMLAGIAARGNAPEVDSRGLASEISGAVVTALQGVLAKKAPVKHR